MPNRTYQDNNYYTKPQYSTQDQLNNGAPSQQYVSYPLISNNAYYNSQQSHVYHDYLYSKNQYTSSSCPIGSYDQDWMADPRVVCDIEKGLRFSEKIETIEITSKDLSPASCCSNFDLLLPDYGTYKNYNKNYTDFPSCSQINNDLSNNKTVKYCSIQKPNNYDCNQYIPTADCFQDVFPTNDICTEVLNFDSVQQLDEDSDIIVEDLDDDYVDESEVETEQKFNCLICNAPYSPLGSQFYYLTVESPLTMSSQKSVSQKLKAIVGNFKESYLCSSCLGLINTIDHLEMKLEEHKKDLIAKFEMSQNQTVRLKKSTNCKHKLSCKTCKKTLSLVTIYRNHVHKHKMQKRFLCEICGKRFQKLQVFNIHMRRHRQKNKFITGFGCKICSKIFRTTSNLKEHENFCSGTLPFKCSKCNKKFASSTKLKTHIKLKHEKKFTSICSICNIGFVQVSEYKRHMISHSTDKKFTCTKCDKSYKTLSNLNFHMKFHETKLPFLCTLCPKGFMRKEYLESHMASHKGERNFPCTMCDKKFVSQKNLDAHMKYHNGEINKKSCNICGKVVSKVALEDHLRTHSNLKEFKCDKCDLHYNTKSALQKHRKRKHDTDQK